jgi:ankyrin repeat protein
MNRTTSIFGIVAVLALGADLAGGASVLDTVKAGNLPAVQTALQQRGDPNEKEADGTTALHWAVQEGRADIVRVLLASGARANATNQYGLTPLAGALMKGNAPITEDLLKAGADAKVRVPGMGPALIAAAHVGNPSVIQALLKAGASANETEKATGQTALMWAAAEGHEEAAKVLLTGGADCRVRSAKGDTAMFFAVRRGDIAVVDALLAAGADVNERTISETTNARNGAKETVPGNTMLVVAVLNAHFRLADFLLSKGADPNAAGAQWTALHALSRLRDYEEHQYPPPMIQPGEIDSLEFARRLIADGANPNARALTTTVKRGPGDQNYKDLAGATPFFLAAKSGDVPYMRLLLAVGVDPSIPSNDKTTPLMIAAGVGCVPGQWIEPERDLLAAAKLLVEELKADVNAVNDRNETALHGAVCRSADSVIKFLADNGAAFEIKDADGLTPLDKAVDHIYLPITINGPVLNRFGAQEHTIVLLKELTQRRAAKSAGANIAETQANTARQP